ncbi:hypothetical protein [Bradyrhizobium sp. LHD-71]|uniref:hypothetical protein n=1 Tax=Bradyrhizobium sp. LHD-71 TaxID=3072141 RepID=UPI00280CB2B2|nr:hypothetical protein [Bradyrhizobium sp. LHD-71]MDQ8731003.1 hypothetical protein [Bradyrhizobium sp. LHD-71]
MPDIARREILRAWSAEDAEVTLTETGLDWLPGSHRVRVQIGKNPETGSLPRYRITVSTDVLRAVPLHEQAFVETASLIADTFCPTYAPVYPPDGRVQGQPNDLMFFASAYVDETTAPWLSGFLARMSILQPFSAERLADDISDQLGGGAPAYVTGSKRDKPNKLVLGVASVIQSEGMAPSHWIDSDEFEFFIEDHARNDFCFGTADETGMTLETPFGSDSALIRFRTDNEAFPPLGSGLAVETQMRPILAHREICKRAAWLNYLESTEWTDFPQLGRWYSRPVSEDQAFLAHSSFVPNMFYAEGLVTNFGLWALARAQWAKNILLPDAKNLTMREILDARGRG